MRFYYSARTRLGLALLLASLVSVILFAAGAWRNHSMAFSYLIWNLCLAWLPLGFGLWLERVLRHKVWSSWEALFASGLWLAFLPNSFYMISDFVHIQELQRVDVLYDVVMFSAFIFSGVTLGFLSLYTIHRQLLQRLRWRAAAFGTASVILLCSFAIYLGRDLRWNSWDILVNPGGILFDISDRFLHPTAYPQLFTTTLSFFVLLGSLYVVVWEVARTLRSTRTP
ncbi:MAG TPA: DUF1361 domain-containing protein [Candidatus Saccharimonadales bacterium]|nr:DUF1361 domain-containing protein [Candidatus Saccharimonadales bacterium]